MVFSSFLFLFVFLPVFLLLYFLSPRKGKNAVALIASYFFYTWGAPQVVLVLFVSSVADFLLSKKLAEAGGRRRKLLLALGLFYNLGLLGYYKYSNFFIAEANRVLFSIGLPEIDWLPVLLPIGISFFTFQKISYLVDVFREVSSPAKNLLNYALYVSLFPQLIAGPIIRYHDVAGQIENRTSGFDDFFYGLYRFCLGLGMKVLIADTVGAVADNVFALKPQDLTMSFAWLGVLCYSLQIYFDFAGYSHMAIGLGRMLGFKFLENFNRPYLAQTFTEFWRRWHISLTNWMKEYLYIPLGGNRVGEVRRYVNLWIVFLLSGLWHGASWNFIVWGIFHGLFLVIDKLGWSEISKKLPVFVNISITFVLVSIGWVFFRSETLAEAIVFLEHMFNPKWFLTCSEVLVFRGDIIHNRGAVVLAAALLIVFFPTSLTRKTAKEPLISQPSTWQVCWQGSLAVLLLVLSACTLGGSSYSPFLYFRF